MCPWHTIYYKTQQEWYACIYEVTKSWTENNNKKEEKTKQKTHKWQKKKNVNAKSSNVRSMNAYNERIVFIRMILFYSVVVVLCVDDIAEIGNFSLDWLHKIVTIARFDFPRFGIQNATQMNSILCVIYFVHTIQFVLESFHWIAVVVFYFSVSSQIAHFLILPQQ